MTAHADYLVELRGRAEVDGAQRVVHKLDTKKVIAMEANRQVDNSRCPIITRLHSSMRASMISSPNVSVAPNCTQQMDDHCSCCRIHM